MRAATLGISVVALLACLLYSYPALSQVQGSSCFQMPFVGRRVASEDMAIAIIGANF
jgi:hypothetical protein